MRREMTAGFVVCAALAGTAQAYEVRAMFQWRPAAGGVFQDVPMSGGAGTLLLGSPDPIRVRLLLGVFDSPTGPAPGGGFLGINQTTITTMIGGSLSLPAGTGRIAPFTFAPANPGNGIVMGGGSSIGGPIDATQGLQQFVWPDGQPQPQAVVTGRNQFASVYQFVDTISSPFIHTITVNSGNVFATNGWEVLVETPPEDGADGSVTWIPDTPVLRSIGNWTLLVAPIPAPGAGACLILGGALLARRRRTR